MDEYNKIFASFDYSQVDLSAIERHIEYIDRFATATKCPMTIYDNVKFMPVYKSQEYINLFGDDNDEVHPEDFDSVIKSGVIAIRYFLNSRGNIKNHRLIRKYRCKVKDSYLVITDQAIPLEFNSNRLVWLVLFICDISPSQSLPYKFESMILNIKTGDVIRPVDKYIDGKPILTKQEVVVLSHIADGLISKEISEKLNVSVHTVNTHRQRILKKLKVTTSLEAIKYASAMGVL